MDPILHVPCGWNTATFGAQTRSSVYVDSRCQPAGARPRCTKISRECDIAVQTDPNLLAVPTAAPALSASEAEAVDAATCVFLKGATPLRRLAALADNSGLPTAKRPAPIGEDSAAGIARGARRRIGRRQQAERMWTPGRTPTDGAVRAGGRCDD